MSEVDLTPDEWQRAWESAYLHSLDLHPDDEIAWERDRWRALKAPSIAGLCERLLQERRSDDFSIPAECSPADLDALWEAIPRDDVMWWVKSGGLCLVAAMRARFWLGQAMTEAAA